MPARLHVVVTGDTNCGKTTLINACLGEPILPAGFQSETSVITYVVPQGGKDCRTTSLYAYRRGAGGKFQELPPAVGAGDVHRSLRRMNRAARESESAACIEARVSSPLRESLRSLLPPNDRPADIVFLDMGGPNETMNTSVHACAELAYSLSHKLIVCVKHDQTRSHTTQHLIEDIRSKAPYHFDDSCPDGLHCPLVFVITQVDQILDEGDPKDIADILRRNLRSLLRRVLPDCPNFVLNVPIIVVSARGALDEVASSTELRGLAVARPVPKAFQLGLLGAQMFRAVFETCSATAAQCEEEGEISGRHAAAIAARAAKTAAEEAARDDLLEVVQAPEPDTIAPPWASVDEWVKFEHHLLRSVAIREEIIPACKILRGGHISGLLKEALESYVWAEGWPFNVESLWGTRRDNAAVAATCVAAVTADVVTAGASLATAGNVAAAAAGANAAASSMKAWLFGQTAVSTASAAANAAAKAMLMVGWSAVDAAGQAILATQNLEGIFDVAGMRMAHAAAVGAGDARETLLPFVFTAAAKEIKANTRYEDVLFYPEDPTLDNNITIPFPFPFQLQHASSKRFLFCNGTQMGMYANSRVNQIFWGLHVDRGKDVFVLQSMEYGFNICVKKGMFSLAIDCCQPPDKCGTDGNRVTSGKIVSQGAISEAIPEGESQAQDASAPQAGSPPASAEKDDTSSMEWRIVPGTKSGTVRLESVAHQQFLYRSGLDMPGVGPARESIGLSSGSSSDQDWIIVPRRPLYIGEFQGQLMNGRGMMFYPDGSPAYKGKFEDAKLKSGFLFNDCGVCHGHFKFNADGSLQLDGVQPEEFDDPSVCIICQKNPCMALGGQAYLPCGHGHCCERCDQRLPSPKECPFCHAAVAETRRVS